MKTILPIAFLLLVTACGHMHDKSCGCSKPKCECSQSSCKCSHKDHSHHDGAKKHCKICEESEKAN